MDTRLLWLAWLASCSTPPTAEVPPKPDAKGTPSTQVTTFAMSKLFLGDENLMGVRDQNAWRTFGYDLDGLVTGDAANVCTPPLWNLSAKDGDLGIDNSWGKNVLYIVEYGTGGYTPTTDTTNAIDSGTWTWQLQVTGLTSDPQQTATGLSAQAFVSGPSEGTPAFDATTDWPVLPSSLADGSTIAGGARLRFATVYVTNGTIVARDATAPLELPIVLLNYFYSDPKPPEPVVLTIRIHSPVVSLQVDGSGGIIAGTLDPEETIDLAWQFGRHLNTLMCKDFIFADEVRAAQDILADGSNAPNVSCDAISIGLRFEAKPIANPDKVGVDPSPTPDLCGDAGAD